MKMLIIALMMSFFVENTWAGVTGFKEYTDEELLAFVLISPELQQTKHANCALDPLSSIKIIHNQDKSLNILLDYKMNNEDSCIISTSVLLMNVTPPGAAGINIRPVIQHMNSICDHP